MNDKSKDFYDQIDLNIPKGNGMHIIVITNDSIISVHDIKDKDDKSKWIIEPLDTPLTNEFEDD